MKQNFFSSIFLIVIKSSIAFFTIIILSAQPEDIIHFLWSIINANLWLIITIIITMIYFLVKKIKIKNLNTINY